MLNFITVLPRIDYKGILRPKVQYSPKIMHAQEVRKKFLRRKNTQAVKRSEVAVYPQEVQSARSSKSYVFLHHYRWRSFAYFTPESSLCTDLREGAAVHRYLFQRRGHKLRSLIINSTINDKLTKALQEVLRSFPVPGIPRPPVMHI